MFPGSAQEALYLIGGRSELLPLKKFAGAWYCSFEQPNEEESISVYSYRLNRYRSLNPCLPFSSTAGRNFDGQPDNESTRFRSRPFLRRSI